MNAPASAFVSATVPPMANALKRAGKPGESALGLTVWGQTDQMRSTKVAGRSGRSLTDLAAIRLDLRDVRWASSRKIDCIWKRIGESHDYRTATDKHLGRQAQRHAA